MRKTKLNLQLSNDTLFPKEDTHMQAQVYEGYYENGKFHPVGCTMETNKRRRAYITVFEDDMPNSGTASVRPPFKFGSMKGRVRMSDDFDAPLDDFKEYAE